MGGGQSRTRRIGGATLCRSATRPPAPPRARPRLPARQHHREHDHGYPPADGGSARVLSVPDMTVPRSRPAAPRLPQRDGTPDRGSRPGAPWLNSQCRTAVTATGGWSGLCLSLRVPRGFCLSQADAVAAVALLVVRGAAEQPAVMDRAIARRQVHVNERPVAPHTVGLRKPLDDSET